MSKMVGVIPLSLHFNCRSITLQLANAVNLNSLLHTIRLILSQYLHYMIEQKQQHQTVPPPVITNPALKTITDQYVDKISSGEIDVGIVKVKARESPEQLFDRKVKEKKLARASRQKEQLQRKLQYLNRSIQSIKDYDYSTGKSSPSQSSSTKVVLSDPTEFVKKNKEFYERVREQKKRLQSKKELQKERIESRLRAQQQQRVKRQEEEKAKRKQQIFENMQRIKRRMDGRQSDIKKREEDYHKVTSGTTLYKKIERQYQQHEINLLEERKKKLANIRNLHRPVTLAEIEEHQRKFLEALKDKESLRERERRLSNASEDYRVSYKSPKHREYVQERTSEPLNESKIKADKMRQFSEHVRENFVPQVDQSKRESIQKQLEEQQQRKKKLESKAEEQRLRVEEIRNKGLRYLEEVKDLPKRRDGNSSSVSPGPTRTQYKNYISHTERGSGTNWTSILGSSVDKRQKAIRVQLQAQKLQKSLQLREQKVRVLKGDPNEVDQQYFEMIKAKLDLLQI